MRTARLLVDYTKNAVSTRLYLEHPMRDHRAHTREGGDVAPIVHTVEIGRRPEDVFSYISDVSHHPEWQESLVRSQLEGEAPLRVGSRVVQARRIGRGERTMTMEVTEHNPPNRWGFRGIDGPVRAIGKGSIEPIDGGTRSRVTMELDFEGHGIGKLLVPLLVRRQAQKEVPKNQQHLKERLEGAT
jgi:uncharacterized protein YndB with AHSA1/START domain